MGSHTFTNTHSICPEPFFLLGMWRWINSIMGYKPYYTLTTVETDMIQMQGYRVKQCERRVRHARTHSHKELAIKEKGKMKKNGKMESWLQVPVGLLRLEKRENVCDEKYRGSRGWRAIGEGRGGFLMEGPDNGEEMMWVFILCMKRHDARGNYNNDTLFLYSTADFLPPVNYSNTAGKIYDFCSVLLHLFLQHLVCIATIKNRARKHNKTQFPCCSCQC